VSILLDPRSRCRDLDSAGPAAGFDDAVGGFGARPMPAEGSPSRGAAPSPVRGGPGRAIRSTLYHPDRMRFDGMPQSIGTALPSRGGEQ